MQAAKFLKARISLFLNLPFASLDQLSLASRLREIGEAEGSTLRRPDVA